MDVSGKQIVSLRKSLGLTQHEFADKIGYSQTYLGDIEVGRTKASRRFLESIKEKFGVSLDSLIHNYLVEWIEYMLTHPAHSNEEKFFFIYSFTDKELLEVEVDLLEELGNRDHILIDAKDMNKFADLVSTITGIPLAGRHAQTQLVTYFEQRDHLYILIKNFSKSAITKKGDCLKKLIKAAGMQTVIVLDKPSFLEKYQEDLYQCALSTAIAKRNFVLT